MKEEFENQELPAVAAPQPCETVTLNVGDKPLALFVDRRSFDLHNFHKLIGLPDGTLIVMLEPPDGQSVAECIAAGDASIFENHIANAKAAEREQCAKIADDCNLGCRCGEWIAAKIRNGE